MAKRKRTGKPLDWPTFCKMFSTEHKCYVFWERILWKNGPVCHRCKRGDKAYESAKKPHHYKCGYCKRYFSVRAIAPMHRSNRPMRDWSYAFYAMLSRPQGINARRLAEELGMEYNTAWRMLLLLRSLCRAPDRKLRGEVEADAHFSGGDARNMHADKKKKGGQGGKHKECIHGVMERATGEVRLLHVPAESRDCILPHILNNVERGSVIYTDEASVYKGLEKEGFRHKYITHSRKEYAKGGTHVNGMESYWAIVNWTISGTYRHVSKKYLHLYLREIEFRFNQGNGRVDTLDRMVALAQGALGQRASFEDLTGRKRDYAKRTCGPTKRRKKPEYRGHAALGGGLRPYVRKTAKNAPLTKGRRRPNAVKSNRGAAKPP